MKRVSWWVAPTAAASLVLSLGAAVEEPAAGSPAASAHSTHPSPQDPDVEGPPGVGRATTTTAPASTAVGSARAQQLGPGQFIGFNGLVYDQAPIVVRGTESRYLYVGQDFDTACGDGGKFAEGLRHLAQIARIIERSGRNVAFTVAPNKASVDNEDLSQNDLPQGICTELGLKSQDKTLDTFQDPNYLPLRKTLVDSVVPTYWHYDTHWTTVGATYYAKALAHHLSPELAHEQRYGYSIRTHIGDLVRLLYTPIAEDAPAKLPSNGVIVTTDPGSDGYAVEGYVTGDHTWTARPAAKTFKGHTLLVGDSFTYTALEPLRVLFHHGHFLWIGLSSLDKIIAGIVASRTISIEVVQRFLSSSVLITKSFRQDLRAALAHSRH